MPSTLDTLTETEIAVRFRETYVSEAINRDIVALTGRGVHRGFRLSTHVSALTVGVLADTDTEDHAAVVRTSTGYALSLRRQGGDFSLDLTAYASKTVVLALYGTYSTGVATTGEIRAYELSPSDEFTGAAEKPYLVPLGTVQVPASGVISAAAITPTNRLEAWEGANLFANPPRQLLQNGGFEVCFANSYTKEALPLWMSRVDADVDFFYPSDVAPASGGSFHLRLDYNGTAVSASIGQNLHVPCAAGDKFRFRAKVRVVTAATAGTFSMALSFVDGVDAFVVSRSIPITSASATYSTVEATLEAPAGVEFLRYAGFQMSGGTLASNGTMLYVDDVELWLDPAEGRSSLQGLPFADARDVMAAKLLLYPSQTAALGSPSSSNLTDLARSLMLRRDEVISSADLLVRAGRVDGNDSAARSPVLNWLSRIIVGEHKFTKLDPHLHTWHGTGAGAGGLSLIWQSVGGTAASGLGYLDSQARLYVDQNSSAVMFTINARAADNATLTWEPDDDTLESFRLHLGDNSFAGGTVGFWPRIEYVPVGFTSWVEADWEQLYVGGEERLRSASYTGPISTNVPHGVGVALVDTTGGAVTLTLPAAATLKNRVVTFKDVGGAFATNALTIARTGSETLDGLAANFVCDSSGAALRVYCDGADFWFV